jgi:hypothetical protein
VPGQGVGLALRISVHILRQLVECFLIMIGIETGGCEE